MCYWPDAYAFLATTIGTIMQTAVAAYKFYGIAKLAIGVAQAVNGGGDGNG